MTEIEFNKYIFAMRGRMVRFAAAILRSHVEAEDVVSDVVERLWKRRDELERCRHVESFIMTSVRNGSYDHCRRRHECEQIEWRPEQSDDQCDRSDTVAMVRYAMTQLPDRQREILHLKDIEGYGMDEIAAIFELEQSNVRMILSRARQALREIIIKLMK